MTELVVDQIHHFIHIYYIFCFVNMLHITRCDWSKIFVMYIKRLKIFVETCYLCTCVKYDNTLELYLLAWFVFFFFVCFNVVLKGKITEGDREREQSSICWFTLQTFAIVVMEQVWNCCRIHPGEPNFWVLHPSVSWFPT